MCAALHVLYVAYCPVCVLSGFLKLYIITQKYGCKYSTEHMYSDM